MGQWLREMSNCCAMEKITYILKNKGESFDKIWAPFTQLPGNVSVSDILQNNDSGHPGWTCEGPFLLFALCQKWQRSLFQYIRAINNFNFFFM